jgi:DNA-binding transcriptional ArsR family regulator
MDETMRDMNLEAMRNSARAVSKLLRILSNEDRLLLLCQLTEGEISVGQLEAALDIKQPTLSQQLGVLRAEGVVKTRREGKRIHYAVSDPKVLTILSTVYSLYCQPQPEPTP